MAAVPRYCCSPGGITHGFLFLKGDQKATARKSVYGDSTTEKVLPTVKKAGVSQMRGSWTGTRDANGEFQEDGGVQHIMLF